MRWVLRWSLAAVSLGATSLHFSVIGPHLDEYTPYGVFFIAIAWLQAAWAVLVVIVDHPRLLVLGLIVNTFVIAIWVWSRTAGLPIGPEPGVAEELGAVDTVSTALEALLIVGTLLLLSRGHRWKEVSRRVAMGSAAIVWGVVILSTTVAIVVDARGAPHAVEGGTQYADLGGTADEHQ